MSVTEEAELTAIIANVLSPGRGRTLIIRPSENEYPEALFRELCRTLENFKHIKIEQDPEGSISIMPPTGGESSYQNNKITAQLDHWAELDGRGKAFDSNILFLLPDGSKLGADASWVSNEKLKTLSRQERREFLRVVPEFVIELKSPTDSYSRLQRKMQDWIRNGVQLGWLIHPDKRLVVVYRNGGEQLFFRVEENNPSAISGEGPVSGFALDLKLIWQGLDF